MFPTAQTSEAHAGEPSKMYASPPASAHPPPPSPPPPPLQPFDKSCRVSEDEKREQLLECLEDAKVEETKDAFLSPRAAPKPPPIPPRGFQNERLQLAFPPEPETAHTNGQARKKRRYPRPSRQQLDRLAENDGFAPPDKEIGCDDSEPLLKKLRSKKRGAVRCAPDGPSRPANFQAKPEDDEEDDLGELIDFSDVEFDIGQDDGAVRHFADFGTDERGFRDRRALPLIGRGRLHGAFTGRFEPGYFTKQRWEDDDGLLRSEAIPSFNDDDLGGEDVFEPAQELGSLGIQGVIEMGIAQSREDTCGRDWFGDKQRREIKGSAVPGGLIAFARTRGRGDEEEEASVGATKYMLDEMHHKNMVRALRGAGKKDLESVMVHVETGEVGAGRATDCENKVKRLQALDKVSHSADSWVNPPSKKRKVDRGPLQARTIDTREVESE